MLTNGVTVRECESSFLAALFDKDKLSLLIKTSTGHRNASRITEKLTSGSYHPHLVLRITPRKQPSILYAHHRNNYKLTNSNVTFASHTPTLGEKSPPQYPPRREQRKSSLRALFVYQCYSSLLLHQPVKAPPDPCLQAKATQEQQTVVFV